MDIYLSRKARKSPQVSSPLLSILTDFNKAAGWMIGVRPQISNSSILLSKLLGSLQNLPITIGIIVIFMPLSFLSSPLRGKYVSIFSTIKNKVSWWSIGMEKSVSKSHQLKRTIKNILAYINTFLV